ncbi:hypothetical protein [Roseibium litorale]|uniref:Uncharacterized protein n=1 Tax=Roseibium litorale TaxID=2803841 RepID=A0ABR9CV34_9HYPH|nr:hypothetical protein [Roseibium litorale]MBD8894354.1 hypothetical protein [Roseibium litorale]
MNIFPAETFDCQVLHPENELVPADRVRQMILHVAADRGIAASECHLLAPSTDQDTYMLCGGFRVLVTQSAPWTGREAVERGITNYPIPKMFPQAERVAASARMVTTLSIGKGLIPASLVPDHLKEAVSPHTQMIGNGEDSRQAMAFLADLTVRFLKLRYATAVVWAANGYILPPDLFTTLALLEDKLDLYIRPQAYAPPQDAPDEDKYIGVIGAGSQYLTGYLVHFLPSTAPVEFMIERLLQFVALCEARNAVIPDGDTFGQDPSERIRVVYEKTPPAEPDRIKLKLEMSAAFGIIGPKVPTVHLQYGLDGSVVEQTITRASKDGLDPDDPVDAAILARLAELKTSGETSEPSRPSTFHEAQTVQVSDPVERSAEPAAYVPPAERERQEAGEDEPPKQSFGTRQRSLPDQKTPTERLSLEELRRIASSSQQEQPSKPSALERLTSFFKGK